MISPKPTLFIGLLGGISSVKNFGLQLTIPSSHAEKAAIVALCGGKDQLDCIQSVALLHMEKVDDNVFVVRFSQPFCFLQAFGIAISRFETKQVA
jgi:hypothetical protein